MEYTASYKDIAELQVFSSVEDMAAATLQKLSDLSLAVDESEGNIHLALSGGSTPLKLFERMLTGFRNELHPPSFELYWGDERCVPPCQPESNYGNMLEAFIHKSGIPDSNVFRIKGEEDPEKEKVRYAELLEKLPKINAYPSFDLTFLGLGEDGHTASVFPNRPDLLNSKELTETAFHPQSLQTRITLTPNVLKASREVLFLVTGKAKARIVAEIFEDQQVARSYPAWHIRPFQGKLTWFCDEEAASELNNLS